jgi:transcriptional regulator with XRE-family HTH domain
VASVSRLIANLKALRLRHNLTQEEFAALSGFNYKYYQEIESGRKKQVLLETVDRLAEAYGVEPGALLTKTPPPDTVLLKPHTPLPQKKWRKGAKS